MFVILDGSVMLFHKDAQHVLASALELDALEHAPEDDSSDQLASTVHDAVGPQSIDVSQSSEGMLAIIDWKCDYDMNRWKRYHCALFGGRLTWAENKHATAHIGEINLCEASTCAMIDRDTVGYTRVAAMLDEKEMAELDDCGVFAILCDEQCYFFDAKSSGLRETWVKNIRGCIPGNIHSPDLTDQGQNTRKMHFELPEWRSQIKTSGKAAWTAASTIFGAPVRHLLPGETLGEITAVLNNRGHTALACGPCVVVELHREMLLEMDLWDLVMPGTMWTSLHHMLRREPLERQNNEIEYIMSAVNYMPLFHQLLPPVRRGILELCRSHVTRASKVLGQYARPFTAASDAPLFIVLQGKIDIYQGHMMLEEAIQALGNVAFEDMHDLFPRKILTVHAEEAWGGPQLIQDHGNQNLCRLQQEVVKEVDSKKAKALRGVIKEQIDATLFTAIATEGTSYLRIEHLEWKRMFAEVDDYVFRTSTLFRILEKPPRDRTPLDARQAACLLYGFLFFQQLPFHITLDLAYSMILVTVEAGIVVAKEGVALDQVLFLLAGNASVHKSRGANNLRLPIGPGKSVTLDDARVFFGPLECTLQAGHSFGTDTLYAKPPVPARSLVASTACHMLQIPADEYRDRLGKYTQVSSLIDDSILAIIRKPAPARIASESLALAQALCHVGILRECPEGLLNELKDFITIESAERGEILAAEGDTEKVLKIVISGSASIHGHDDYDMGSHIESGAATSNAGIPSVLSSPTPNNLCMKWGMCVNVIQIGGSFGELTIATGLPRSTSVIARESCRLLTLHSGNLPSMVLSDLRDFIASSKGVPAGLQKPLLMRTEFDAVKAMGFLSTLEQLEGYPLAVMANLARIAEFRSYEMGDVIQDDSTRGTYVHIVHGGKIEIEKEKDAANILMAASPTRSKVDSRANASQQPGVAYLSPIVALECLQNLTTGVFPQSGAVKEVIRAAVNKSTMLLSLETKRLHMKHGLKAFDEEAASGPGQLMEDVRVLECGKHFILGRAKALVSRTGLVRLDWSKMVAFVSKGHEDAIKATAAFLAQTKPFANWKPKLLNALAQRSKTLKFPRNSVIVSKGHELTGVLYLVKSGTCSLHGTLALHGLQGVDMMTDDKLYRTSGPQGAGDAHTSRKLFRCPNCTSGSLSGGSPQRQSGTAKRACALCQDTGTIRSDALKKSTATLAHQDQHVEVSLGVITTGSIVNTALHQIGKPLEHAIVADNGCELYAIATKDLIDVCDGNLSMLQDLRAECRLMDDWHSRRKSMAQGAHSKLHEQGDLLLHPRPQEDFGGEKPNQNLLKIYHALPLKSWSKALGSASWSKSGSKASKLLNTPQPLKTHSRDESPEKTMGEKRSAALGLHNMEKTKAKYDASAAVKKPVDEQAHDSAPDGRRGSQVLRISRTPFDHALTEVEEEDHDHDQLDGNAHIKPRRITHFSSGQPGPGRTGTGMSRVPRV